MEGSRCRLGGGLKAGGQGVGGKTRIQHLCQILNVPIKPREILGCSDLHQQSRRNRF